MSIRYPHLESLKIFDRDWFSTTSPLWSSIADFINENPTSTTIQLTANKTTELPIEIWDTIKENKNVKALRLDRIKIDVSQARSFWKACTVLEKLDMNHCTISDPWEDVTGSRPLPPLFPLIQEINFTKLEGINEYGQLQIAAMSPRLRSLCWNGTGFPITRFAFDNTLGISLLNLDELDLKGKAHSTDIAFFIATNKKPLKKLAVPLFTRDSFINVFEYASRPRLPDLSCLERHFSTLQDLDFADSTPTSIELLKILSLCPLLTSFKANVILASDVKRNEAWACADRLLKLDVCIDLGQCNPEVASRRVFACLSKLTSLEDLNLGRNETTDAFLRTAVEPLRLQLDHGMDQLSTLWRMKRFYFSDQGQTMTMKEGRWIKKHWRGLEVIQGTFNPDEVLNAQINNLFRRENKRFLRRQKMIE
ncbi:hypothetical protein BGX21_001915 [Mortierella sp. AD011]|nr:hypothetical protein BGX20_008561 [Mortierella sp. AD010]KAF9401366.1 hypothetical protein BGX21_001915 [Mortierella sp. AD011]